MIYILSLTPLLFRLFTDYRLRFTDWRTTLLTT